MQKYKNKKACPKLGQAKTKVYEKQQITF